MHDVHRVNLFPFIAVRAGVWDIYRKSMNSLLMLLFLLTSSHAYYLYMYSFTQITTLLPGHIGSLQPVIRSAYKVINSFNITSVIRNQRYPHVVINRPMSELIRAKIRFSY